ncbi:hypothetical protein Y032_0152g2896 [Ancylostoma ceylanicum]|uniref:RNA-directed DNA polymerase n=1 Tax=Ancylostoma ceylanicum TaxID=53326 RepID=A0A016T119_9BILA|nr:hypothetical protein Y032_0152g2896 [Ancylostoma ceylanicum]
MRRVGVSFLGHVIVNEGEGKSHEHEQQHHTQGAIVGSVQGEPKTKWVGELEQEEDWARVIELVRKNKWEKVVKMDGVEPVRVADFVIEDRELEMYREDDSLVFVVPKRARFEVFFEAHAGVIAGHFSAYKLLNLLKRQVFWPEMGKDIHKWTKQCQTCYIANPLKVTTPPLRPIVTSEPYEVVGVDILELGQTSAGNRYAVTVIDHFSMFAAAYPVPDKSAETVAKALFYRWIVVGCRWPRSILSDRGGEFENRVMDEIEKIANIKHIFTKGHNPRENGITERLNGTIVAVLRRTTVVPTEWDLRLPFCIMAYNKTPHSSTGQSPHFVLHGIDPIFPSSTIPSTGVSRYTMDKAMDHYKTAVLQGIVETHERVKEYNDRMRARMKKFYDEGKNVDGSKLPAVGERVYVEVPMKMGKSKHPKLACEWSGPFRVIDVTEKSATVTRIGENSETANSHGSALNGSPKFSGR